MAQQIFDDCLDYLDSVVRREQDGGRMRDDARASLRQLGRLIAQSLSYQISLVIMILSLKLSELYREL